MFHTGAQTRLLRTPNAAAFALAASLALLLTGCGPTVSDASLRPLGTSGVAERLDRNPNNTLLIDARSPNEFAEGSIPGAQNLTLRDLPPNFDRKRFDGYGAVIVFGTNPASGSARAVAKRLMAGGVSPVFFYEGGYEAWRRETR